MRDRIVSIRTNATPAEWQASGLVGAVPVAGSSSPELILDPARWDPYEHVGERFRGGIDVWEGLLAGDVSLSPIEAFYTAATFDTTRRLGPRSVGYDDAVIGYRFVVEPEEGSPFPEGRVVVLNFETYYFEEEPVAEAARMSIDWLLEGRH